MSIRKTAIIVASGKGERMNAAVPKQFMELDGQPVVMHTLRKFHIYDPETELILVLPAGYINLWKELCIMYHFKIPHKIICGGETRFLSVRNALDEIADHNGLIAVHDGVRPLVDTETIRRGFQEAERSGAAIPVIDMIDSVRKIDSDTSMAVDRKDYKLVQTPQIFRAGIILKSYTQASNELFTDDASVVEASGYDVKLFDGNRENIKITTMFDMKLAEIILTHIG